MQRFRNGSLSYPWWLLILLPVLLLALTIIFSAPAQAEGRPGHWTAASPQGGGQMFYENLTVAEGDVYEGDVTVAAGNVLVEDGGLIEGNLIVWSGNIAIHEGGEVEGDVSALSGNVSIGGNVGGSVAAVSGNIELLETANVDGDISVISGDVLRAPEAEVDGNIIKGSGFKIPMPFSGWAWGADRALTPVAPAAPVMAAGPSFWGWLGWTILRMMLAVIFTAVIVTLVCVLYNLRPDVIRPLAPLVRERAAYTFVVGLIVNLVLLVLTSALFFTVCLAILGLAPGLVLVALNLVGWTLASQMIGERVAGYFQRPMEPLAKVAIGAIVATGAVMLLWALGSCFRPAAHLLWLVISSFGVGAAVVHWLKLDRTDPAASQTGEPAPATPPQGPAPAVSPVATEEPPVAATPSAVTVEPSVSEEPAALLAPPPLQSEADFTVIKGIGATFDRRLKAAGVRTFAELAALTPEQLAEIIGWAPQRVIADDLLGQARLLASGRA